jgi:hypothetical protein
MAYFPLSLSGSVVPLKLAQVVFTNISGGL